MYRITLIEDINKIKRFVKDEVLTVEEFDELYDRDIEELEMILAINSRFVQYSPLT
jgi:hypothetical protein